MFENILGSVVIKKPFSKIKAIVSNRSVSKTMLRLNTQKATDKDKNTWHLIYQVQYDHTEVAIKHKQDTLHDKIPKIAQ